MPANPASRAELLPANVVGAHQVAQAAVDCGVRRFTVANGISANRYRIADLTETMQQLNYHPVDDAWG